MKAGPGPLRLRRAGTPVLLRVYLVGGGVVLGVLFLLYFQRLAVRVEEQTEAMSALVAQVMAATTLSMTEPDPALQDQFQLAVQALNFPVVLTDPTGRPMLWKNLGVGDMTIDEILIENLDDPTPRFAMVMESVDRMDAKHAPIAMYSPGTDEPLMYMHYGLPSLSRELRWIPWVTILAAAVFALVGLLLIRGLKRSEESFIWAGMAKESAHQMGTPLSSLIGWMEVLRDEVELDGDRAVLPAELFDEVVQEVGRDTDRLNRVAARFSQIGSTPQLVVGPVGPVVESTVDYFRRRVPEGVNLELDMDAGLPPVALNAELMGWVLENLVKNALNAVPGGRGTVRVRALSPDPRRVAIRVRDDGKGVDPGMERQIFRPGVSTRRRGWGLGLPLSVRIVEAYHGGRLELTWSEPGKGAEFTVTLPAASAPAVEPAS